MTTVYSAQFPVFAPGAPLEPAGQGAQSCPGSYGPQTPCSPTGHTTCLIPRRLLPHCEVSMPVSPDYAGHSMRPCQCRVWPKMAAALNLNRNLFFPFSIPRTCHPVPRHPLLSLDRRLPNPFSCSQIALLAEHVLLGRSPACPTRCVKLVRLPSRQLQVPVSFSLTDRIILFSCLRPKRWVISHSVLPFINATPTPCMHGSIHTDEQPGHSRLPKPNLLRSFPPLRSGRLNLSITLHKTCLRTLWWTPHPPARLLRGFRILTHDFNHCSHL